MASSDVRLKYILGIRYIDCTNEEPALHQAVIRNDLEVLQLFMECKTDINIVDKHGKLPIAYIKEYSQLEVLKFLLAAGSNIYQLDKLGMMQFSTAFRSGQEAVIKEYLKYKINLNMPDSHGQTAIHYLMDNSCKGIAKNLMILNYNFDAKDRRGRTPMYLAIKKENLYWVKLLLKKGANVNYILELESLPLYEMIRYFCDDPNTKKLPLGYSPFMLECLELLIHKSAEVNSILYGSYTNLKLTLKYFHFSTAKTILKRLSLIEISGSPIIEINRRTIEQYPKAKLYYSQLIAELKIMIELQVHPGVSYFSILLEDNINMLAKYFKNKDVNDAQRDINNFREFYGVFVYKYLDGFKRASNIEVLEEVLSEIFYLYFPPHVIRKITICCFPDSYADYIIGDDNESYYIS